MFRLFGYITFKSLGQRANKTHQKSMHAILEHFPTLRISSHSLIEVALTI